MHFSRKLKDLCWYSGSTLISLIGTLAMFQFSALPHLHNKNYRDFHFQGFPGSVQLRYNTSILTTSTLFILSKALDLTVSSENS